MKTNASDSGAFCHGALTQHVPTWRRLRGFIEVTAKLFAAAEEVGSICRRHNTTQDQPGVWEARRPVNTKEPLSPCVGTPFHHPHPPHVSTEKPRQLSRNKHLLESRHDSD